MPEELLNTLYWTAAFFESIFSKHGKEVQAEEGDYILRVKKRTTEGVIDIQLLKSST